MKSPDSKDEVVPALDATEGDSGDASEQRLPFVIGASEPDLEPGSSFGAYVVEHKVGQGGFASIYAIRRVDDGTRRALKILSPQHVGTQMQMRFLREAQAIHLLRHPNIVQIHAFGIATNGRPYFIMDLLSGLNLRELVRKRGRFAIEDAVTIIVSACSAVGAAHAHDIVHRDIKSSNMMLVDSDPRQLKLLDFGVAKFLNMAGVTAKDAILGSVSTMAPEQLNGSGIDHRADIYALGVVLYQLVTGRLPFMGSNAEVASLHLTALPPPPSAFAPVPRELDDIVLRCLEKSPAARYTDAAELAAALELMRDHLKPAAVLTQATERRARGIGVYFEVVRKAPPSPDKAVDETLALAALTDRASEVLEQEGLKLCLQAGSTLLGVAELPSDPDASEELRLHCRHVAEALTSLDPEDQGVELRVGIHESDASISDAGEVTEFTGSAELLGGGWWFNAHEVLRKAQGILKTTRGHALG